MTWYPLFDSLIRVSPLQWQRVLEGAQVIKSILMKVLLIISDGLSKETAIAAHLFSARILDLVKGSGFLFTALYCKQAAACLQQYYGGDKRPHTLLPVPVSLTRSGIPRIIPSFHRHLIMKRDDRADFLVQVYLSFFSVSKIILVAKKVNKDTFASIVSPPDFDTILGFVSDYKFKLKVVVSRYLPFVSSIPLYQGMVWEPTWKVLPSYRIFTPEFKRRIWYQAEKPISAEKKKELRELGRIRSCFPVQILEMVAFQHLEQFVASRQEQWISGVLWPHRVRFALDKNNKSFTPLDLEWYEANVGPILPTPQQVLPSSVAPACGQLSASIEGGGKRRIFAIGNYVKQRLLRPVHDWLMEVLSRIPMDGTFNQVKPLDRLVGEKVVFSFDLTAATDRWPLVLLFETITFLFDRSFASAVVNTALACNIFKVQFVKRHAEISFITGQPLGYYSSWPLFALTHHLVIMVCAEKVYPGRHFDSYAVLGDDVVIADSEVAACYEQALSQLGVKISMQKSLISHYGCAEFAKRFRVRDLSKDLSPVSIKSLLNFSSPYGLLAISTRYNIPRLSTVARIGGLGYKARSHISHSSPSKRGRRMMAMHSKALWRGHLKEWLGQGRLLSPTLIGHLIHFLRKTFRPKQLKPLDPRVIISEERKFLSEITIQREWMKQWLRYVHWYWKVAMDPWVTLDDFVSAPVVTTQPHMTRKDENLLRFGVWFKLFDMVCELGVGYTLPSVGPSSPGSFPGYLLGGFTGSDFLIESSGLVQPRARQGVIICGNTNELPVRTIYYKTLGVPDRQSVLDFDRRRKSSVVRYSGQ